MKPNQIATPRTASAVTNTRLGFECKGLPSNTGCRAPFNDSGAWPNNRLAPKATANWTDGALTLQSVQVAYRESRVSALGKHFGVLRVRFWPTAPFRARRTGDRVRDDPERKLTRDECGQRTRAERTLSNGPSYPPVRNLPADSRLSKMRRRNPGLSSVHANALRVQIECS
jgi:hypothetical protein